jgi:hypothetical protein
MLLVYEGESLNVDMSEFVVSASGGVILQKGSKFFGGKTACSFVYRRFGRFSSIFGRITVSTLACQLDGTHLPNRR